MYKRQGYLGITGFDVTAQNAEQFGMPTGVYIDEVTRGGGADDAGLTKGNVITANNGTRVEDVYKRQRCACALLSCALLVGCFVLPALFAPPCLAPLCVAPVSYTHLDVYKRQVSSFFSFVPSLTL